MKRAPRSPEDVVAGIIKDIERLAGARAKAVRAEYADTMREHHKTFSAAQRIAALKEREALKEIERQRVTAIAAVDPSRPVVLSDIASVKRQTSSGAVVSVARVSCLEKRA